MEAQISEDQLTQVSQLKTVADRIDSTVINLDDWIDFPFKKIVREEAKLITKLIYLVR